MGKKGAIGTPLRVYVKDNIVRNVKILETRKIESKSKAIGIKITCPDCKTDFWKNSK